MTAYTPRAASKTGKEAKQKHGQIPRRNGF